MQQQQYGSYGPYYGYPSYSTPYMGSNPTTSGYPPFYGPPQSQQPPPAPHTNNPPAPAPYSFDAAAYSYTTDSVDHAQIGDELVRIVVLCL